MRDMRRTTAASVVGGALLLLLLLGGCGGSGSGPSAGAGGPVAGAPGAGGMPPVDNDDGMPSGPGVLPEPPPVVLPPLPTPPRGSDGVALVTRPATKADSARFLTQASFGSTLSEIARVTDIGYEAWLAEQFARQPVQTHLQWWQAERDRLVAGTGTPNNWINHRGFWRTFATAEDQLRQRMMFSLSQIFVVSFADTNIDDWPRGVASYTDVLSRNAFGSFRTLLDEVARHPMMGIYLTHLGNRGDAGRTADENFGREIMQLMTIGLHQLNPDGTLRRDAQGLPIETYDGDDVAGISKVFTGWSWAGSTKSQARFEGKYPDRSATRDITPMQLYPQFHSSEEKRFLGTTIAAGTDGEASLKIALDTLFHHPNVGPFIGKQLIQRLVTSNPSPAYVARVAAAFADNGAGVRGDLRAVVRAILLDPEARIAPPDADTRFGRVRDPLLRFSAWMRAFDARSPNGQWYLRDTDSPETALGQTPFNAPSVFNFYRPGYVPPNSDVAAAGLVAPELQIANETSVAGYQNFMYGIVRRGIFDNQIVPDYDPMAAIAHDPDLLLDRLDLLLTAGRAPSTTRASIRAVVNGIPIPSSDAAAIAAARRSRVQAAAYLLLVSPAFVVQR